MKLWMPGLFVVTALAEIVGCYLPWLWLRREGSPWLLVPAAASLALFVWLLTLHPMGAGRTYVAYGGVYVVTSLVWAWAVDGEAIRWMDVAGVSACLAGMALLYFGRA